MLSAGAVSADSCIVAGSTARGAVQTASAAVTVNLGSCAEGIQPLVTTAADPVDARAFTQGNTADAPCLVLFTPPGFNIIVR